MMKVLVAATTLASTVAMDASMAIHLNFNELPAGTILDEYQPPGALVGGFIGFESTNRCTENRGDPAVVRIFPSGCTPGDPFPGTGCPGGDDDLAIDPISNLKKVVISSEKGADEDCSAGVGCGDCGFGSNPQDKCTMGDEFAVGAITTDCNTISLDFTNYAVDDRGDARCINVEAFTIIDNEEPTTEPKLGKDSFWIGELVDLDDPEGPSTFVSGIIPTNGDNEFTVETTPALTCVRKLSFHLQGSGAVDDIKLAIPFKDPICKDKKGVTSKFWYWGRKYKFYCRDYSKYMCDHWQSAKHCPETCGKCCEKGFDEIKEIIHSYLDEVEDDVCDIDRDDKCKDDPDAGFYFLGKHQTCESLAHLPKWHKFYACNFVRAGPPAPEDDGDDDDDDGDGSDDDGDDDEDDDEDDEDEDEDGRRQLTFKKKKKPLIKESCCKVCKKWDE